MATTPAYALPYPVGTDRVMDGDNAIQALAERVEALLTPVAGEAWGTGNQSVASYGQRWMVLNASELTGGLALANSNVPTLGGNVAVRLVLPKAGVYLVHGALEIKWAVNPGDIMFGVGIFLNVAGELVWAHASCIATHMQSPNKEYTNPTHAEVVMVRAFAANDWIGLGMTHNAGAAAELVTTSGRTGSRLGATLISPRN